MSVFDEEIKLELERIIRGDITPIDRKNAQEIIMLETTKNQNIDKIMLKLIFSKLNLHSSFLILSYGIIL